MPHSWRPTPCQPGQTEPKVTNTRSLRGQRILCLSKMDVERALEKAEGCRMGVLLWEGALEGSPPGRGPRDSPCGDLEIQAGSYRSLEFLSAVPQCKFA
ncbi:hypothetical protein ACRRTK_016671 [Alexandromys fortis]